MAPRMDVRPVRGHPASRSTPTTASPFLAAAASAPMADQLDVVGFHARPLECASRTFPRSRRGPASRLKDRLWHSRPCSINSSQAAPCSQNQQLQHSTPGPAPTTPARRRCRRRSSCTSARRCSTSPGCERASVLHPRARDWSTAACDHQLRELQLPPCSVRREA